MLVFFKNKKTLQPLCVNFERNEDINNVYNTLSVP